jgi:hypothetical protein
MIDETLGEQQISLIKALHNRTLKAFGEPITKTVKYELSNGRHTEYPSPHVVEILLNKGILVRDPDDPLIIQLAPPRECKCGICKHKHELLPMDNFVSTRSGGMICRYCIDCRERIYKSKRSTNPKQKRKPVFVWPADKVNFRNEKEKGMFEEWFLDLLNEVCQVSELTLGS